MRPEGRNTSAKPQAHVHLAVDGPDGPVPILGLLQLPEPVLVAADDEPLDPRLLELVVVVGGGGGGGGALALLAAVLLQPAFLDDLVAQLLGRHAVVAPLVAALGAKVHVAPELALQRVRGDDVRPGQPLGRFGRHERVQVVQPAVLERPVRDQQEQREQLGREAVCERGQLAQPRTQGRGEVIAVVDSELFLEPARGSAGGERGGERGGETLRAWS